MVLNSLYLKAREYEVERSNQMSKRDRRMAYNFCTILDQYILHTYIKTISTALCVTSNHKLCVSRKGQPTPAQLSQGFGPKRFRSIQERTAKATGVSRTTARAISDDHEASASSSTSRPAVNGPNKALKSKEHRLSSDDFDSSVIRQVIGCNMYDFHLIVLIVS
ncbi:hypothetical protein EVAR_95991_1 [Eumeta japonica]|uniref:Uncharacterized protein n=1 Tax=Eumeta variegata TaxID=151549 RepID=A0A4C2A0Q7_EUMVA|nr:hypothetical protein EVAR_95991_1 [Eumeta japonica]